MEPALLEAIRTRRSIRKFTPEAVDEKTFFEIVEMGTWAPSGIPRRPGEPASGSGSKR